MEKRIERLEVRNGVIIDAKGNPVRLRGTCVGGPNEGLVSILKKQMAQR